MKKVVFLILLFNILVWNGNIFSQEVPHSVSNTGIYNFLDELANNQIIEINSAVKPYSRLYIANKLKEAEEKKEQLNTRQQKELEFYLLDFGKELSGSTAQGRNGETVRSFFGRTSSGEGRTTHDARRRDLFYYRDSLFSLTVNPILGGEMFNNSAGNATYWRNGAEARAYVGNWGFYASLRDNHEKPLLGKPEYLTAREGGHIKGSTDWSEMQGGVTYSWKWGNAGLVKERQQWGNNYNGANIFGGNNPSFTQLKLQITPVKWFSFNYFHGWLNSQVVDSTSSYWVTNSYGTDYREVYHKKFIAANMFTFTPFKNLNLSAGNSIVYSDENMNPAYLIPLFFYKSVDHSLTSGIDNMNSQLYFDISSRQIKHLHVYGTLFIDELSVSRFGMKDEWNFFSWKAGFRLTDLPVTNLSFTTEFTYTYPLTFQHYVPTLTFETAGYNLGHFMKDNSREWYAALNYRPLRTLDINLFFTDAIRGPDYTALGTDRLGNPPLASVEWHNTTYGLKASYQVINDLYTWVAASQSNIRGSMVCGCLSIFRGKRQLLMRG
ncbi:MAG: hypothetical protein IPJ16_08400 [Bacteroidales bacterium]|nr:hypothetical protein [Bacteroidales bacterium]